MSTQPAAPHAPNQSAEPSFRASFDWFAPYLIVLVTGLITVGIYALAWWNAGSIIPLPVFVALFCIPVLLGWWIAGAAFATVIGLALRVHWALRSALTLVICLCATIVVHFLIIEMFNTGFYGVPAMFIPGWLY